jgi:cytoskeleton protein RodZ
MEVSAREVADALNLPIRVIEALEADDYERLPPTVFTRGYLRSYARLLELPADKLLALYPEVVTETDSGTIETVAPPTPDQRQMKLAMVGGVVLIAVVALAVWFLGGDDADQVPTAEAPAAERPSPAGEEPVQPTEPSEPAAEPQELAELEVAGETPAPAAEAVVTPPVQDTRDDAAAGGGTPETLADVEAAPTSEAAATAPVEAVPPTAGAADIPFEEPTVTAAAEPGVRRITPFGDDLITFTFNEECWVEVKALDGENLYSDLNRAGRTLKLQGRGPFRILLGYAPGVALQFNGEPVPLTRYTRNNVATLVLGE